MAIVLSMSGIFHLCKADGYQYDATDVLPQIVSNQPSGPLGKLIISHSILAKLLSVIFFLRTFKKSLIFVYAVNTDRAQEQEATNFNKCDPLNSLKAVSKVKNTAGKFNNAPHLSLGLYVRSAQLMTELFAYIPPTLIGDAYKNNKNISFIHWKIQMRSECKNVYKNLRHAGILPLKMVSTLYENFSMSTKINCQSVATHAPLALYFKHMAHCV